MNDNNEMKIEGSEINAPTIVPKRFSEKFENFWYHYKWHTIVAVFVIFVVAICSFQMCSKEKYDSYIIYAGPKQIKKTSETGDIPPYSTFCSSLGKVCLDFDENGTVSVAFKDLFMLSDAEIKEIESLQGYEVNYNVITENNQIFRDLMANSDYYVCLLSDDLYNTYKTLDGVELFVPLAAYANEDNGLVYKDECAVYLSSTGFYSLPGICDLPDDTVLCLRKITPLGSHFNKSDSEKHFKRSEEIVSNILSYKKK